jgi:hypothetical protein
MVEDLTSSALTDIVFGTAGRKKLETIAVAMTIHTAANNFGPQSRALSSVWQRSQNFLLDDNRQSTRSIFSPQLQQKLGRYNIVSAV